MKWLLVASWSAARGTVCSWCGTEIGGVVSELVDLDVPPALPERDRPRHYVDDGCLRGMQDDVDRVPVDEIEEKIHARLADAGSGASAPIPW